MSGVRQFVWISVLSPAHSVLTSRTVIIMNMGLGGRASTRVLREGTEMGFKGLVACVVAACGIVAGCGSFDDESESYSYEYNVNGCSTGKKTFSQKSAYCSALKDDGANNFCASDVRQKAWESNCR